VACERLAAVSAGLTWPVLRERRVADTSLFDDRSQLLVYHFMFGYGDRVDEQNQGCVGCSFVADHFDAVVTHLNGHDVTLVAESIAPLDELRSYKQRMGWRFPWVSSGMSAFAFADGVVYRTYSTYARGVEQLMGIYRFLDLAGLGRNERAPADWWRRHDEYQSE
jgi:predicted dithiol-disulfide oxidoreductase (DUF899 family)